MHVPNEVGVQRVGSQACFSSTRLEYKELGLKLVSLEDRSSRTPKRPLMAGEKKYDWTGDPFKLLI
jgi:hypothetical protein